ncbi:unnamed protein product [Anisakis simplex]|uniref:NAD(P)-binding protein n=1 Tax=Anisakis simplex TaxID=6269 RepID=A0A0M3K380_ANISI|nr:unnamed protein product [Anisakis simplex]
MGNTDVARESSSCSSGSSPPPMSTEDERHVNLIDSSVSPQKLLHNSSTLNGYKDVSSKKPPITAPKPIIRSSAIKIARADSSSSEHVARSPFKQTLAESGSLNRHREELFSPEIRRRCELPVSSKLRSSLANLTTDESDDGRASPVAPFIQRFNSKTRQSMNVDAKPSRVSAYERLLGIWTILFIYVIGLYYSFVEFVKDNFWIRRRYSTYSQKLESEITSSEFLHDSLSRQKACAVVTGASGTIGIEIVRLLLKLGFRVEALADQEGDLLTVEDSERLNAHIFDISDFEKVKMAVDEIRTASPNGISLIVCNAGVMLHPYKVNRWGYEHHMAVNVLSHALLVDLLLSHIEPIHHQLRIVFVSSSTAHAGYIDPKVPLKDLFNRYVNGYQAYADSKLLVAFYAEELHRSASVSALEVLATVFSDHLKGGSYYERMEPVRLKAEIPHTTRQKVFELIRQAIKI